MQLFILIMVNIFIAAIFYLIIILRIERSANELRSRKLRKEMEELINEFNYTAERNLSLLEHKINVLRELLKRADALPSIDVTVYSTNNPVAQRKQKKKHNSSSHNHTSIVMNNSNQKEEIELSQHIGSDDFKNGFTEIQKNDYQPTTVSFHSEQTVTPLSLQIKEIAKELVIQLKAFALNTFVQRKKQIYRENTQENIQKCIRDKENNYNGNETKEELISQSSHVMDEEHASALYANADDKYAAIVQLYEMGYPLPLLSKISGLSAGEVSLIVNLANRK